MTSRGLLKHALEFPNDESRNLVGFEFVVILAGKVGPLEGVGDGDVEAQFGHLVGELEEKGQAVNFWAEYFTAKGRDSGLISHHAPFTSKDR